MNWGTVHEWLEFFNSKWFKRIAFQEKNQQIFTAKATYVLRPILTLIQLRRVMGSTMNIGDGLIRIEENVPLYRIFTVELRMGDRQHASYMALHDNYAEAL